MFLSPLPQVPSYWLTFFPCLSTPVPHSCFPNVATPHKLLIRSLLPEEPKKDLCCCLSTLLLMDIEVVSNFLRLHTVQLGQHPCSCFLVYLCFCRMFLAMELLDNRLQTPLASPDITRLIPKVATYIFPVYFTLTPAFNSLDLFGSSGSSLSSFSTVFPFHPLPTTPHHEASASVLFAAENTFPTWPS